MTTSKGYCSFRAHWVKKIKNTIIIHQIPQTSKRHLFASQHIPVHMHPSAGNYPVLKWIIACELIQVGLLISVCASSLKLWGGWLMIGASLSEPHTSVIFWTTCIDRPTNRPTNQPTDRPIDRLTDWPTDWPTDRPTDRPTDWLTDRPTDRPCHSHSRDMDTLHVPMPPCHAHVNSAVRVVIATRLRMPTMEKRKAETPTHWTVRLERERDQRSPSYLCFLVGVAITYVTSHKALVVIWTKHFCSVLLKYK